AYHQGVRYSYSRTRLIPTLAQGVYFRSQRVNVGIAGLGVAVPGNLRGYGSARLEYGPDLAVDGYETVQAWGIGASLSKLVETAALTAGTEPPAFTRFI